MMKEVEVPEGVEVELNNRAVKVNGPKGELVKSFDDPRFNRSVEIKKDGKVVITSNEKRKNKAFVGTLASNIRNMIIGVTVGFRYTMKIYYSHFPMTITVKDNEVQIRNFLGEKGARTAKVVGKSEVKAEKDQITVNGISIEDVGQTCANIEQACKLSKRDRRIFLDGIYLSARHLQNGEEL